MTANTNKAITMKHVMKQLKTNQIESLNHCLDDDMVLKNLCLISVETHDHQLRDDALRILKNRPLTSGRFFAALATTSSVARIRKWAFVNMSILKFTNTRGAVLKGLGDADFKVASAAALNTGIYTDSEFSRAFEDFIERNRFYFGAALIAQLIGDLKGHSKAKEASLLTQRLHHA